VTKPVVILVSPKGEANVGGIARLMGNFSLTDLRVVDPRCDLNGADVRKMSLQAYPLVERAQIFDDVVSAQADLKLSAALSMRPSSSRSPHCKLSKMFENEAFSSFPFSAEFPWGFVFGREDSGLTNDELRLVDLQVEIPSHSEMPSLNIVSAVAITLFHWFEAIETCSKPSSLRTDKPLKADEDIFFDGLEKMLRDISFLKSSSPSHILEDLRDMYHRSNMSARDLRILFGILSDLGRTHKKNYCPPSGAGKKSCS